MKLYLTEILKEATDAAALSFGAPGQGGNASDVAYSNTTNQITPQTAPTTNPMMSVNLGTSSSKIDLSAPPLTPTIA